MTPNEPKPIYRVNGRSPQQPQTETFVELMLDNMESERDMMIPRLRYVEGVLLEHGRISRRAVVSREEDRG